MRDASEMIAIVQAYINHRKDVEVDIYHPTNERQMMKLAHAYTIAVDFFNSNNGSIKKL